MLRVSWFVRVVLGVVLAAGLAVRGEEVKPATGPAVGGGGFSLVDTPGEFISILRDGRMVARYMYAHDISTPQRREETFTPYIHVFDAEGKMPITKGPGGWIPYHRGIFVGWKVLGFEGKTIDRIEMKTGEIVHREFAEKHADREEATLTAMIDWNDDQGKAFITEERRMSFRGAAAPARLTIDLSSTFAAPRSKVWFGGDWVHNGVQYRGSNEAERKETKFLYPAEDANPKKDRDYPWVGMSYSIKHEGKLQQYSVIQMNDARNPKGSEYGADSAARLAVCFNATVQPKGPLTVRYRFVIGEGALPERGMIQRWSEEFSAASKGPAATEPKAGEVKGAETGPAGGK